MIRCKCGTWSDFGMTCVACRGETYSNMRPPSSKEGEGVEETIDVDEEPMCITEDYSDEEEED